MLFSFEQGLHLWPLQHTTPHHTKSASCIPGRTIDFPSSFLTSFVVVVSWKSIAENTYLTEPLSTNHTLLLHELLYLINYVNCPIDL